MSSLRRPPIEFLFVSLFILFLFLFVVCRSKTSRFILAGDPRSQEFRPRRRCEAGPAAPKPMAPGNDVTLSWRHAVDRRFGAAVDNTRGVVIPSPHLLLRPLPFPAYHSCPSTAGLSRVRPPSSNREVGTLSDSALEPSPRCPAPGHQPTRFLARFEDLGLVSPRALSSL